MRVASILIAVTLSSFCSFAFAEDCRFVRLDSNGGSMEHVPVRDQGNWGICYAAAAAQMVDAYEFSHGSAPNAAQELFRSSMIEGAIGSGRDQKSTLKNALAGDGGFSCDVASYYKKAGSCNSNVLAGEGNELTNDLAFLSQSYSIHDEDQPDPCGARKEKKDSIAEIHELLKGQTCTDKEAANERVASSAQDLMSVLDSVTKSAEERVTKELDRACKSSGRKPARFSSCKETEVHSVKDFQRTTQFILGHLSSNAVQPLAIGYCSSVLTEGNRYVGLNLHPDSSGNAEKCDCGSHESLVIGKRANPKTGKCEFLVQNSWGTDCDGYSGDWECASGKIWIDADVLSKNIEDYSRLK